MYQPQREVDTELADNPETKFSLYAVPVGDSLMIQTWRLKLNTGKHADLDPPTLRIFIDYDQLTASVEVIEPSENDE